MVKKYTGRYICYYSSEPCDKYDDFDDTLPDGPPKCDDCHWHKKAVSKTEE